MMKKSSLPTKIKFYPRPFKTFHIYYYYYYLKSRVIREETDGSSICWFTMATKQPV